MWCVTTVFEQGQSEKKVEKRKEGRTDVNGGTQLTEKGKGVKDPEI